MIKAPILHFPSFDKPFVIRTDASRSGVGGVLLQKDEEKEVEYPIYYVSRSLSKSEKNYGITDLEGCAIHYCVKKFKQYIMGNSNRTTIITDHKPLVPMLMKNQPNNDRHAKWCEEIRSLNIEVKYEDGKKNVLADALSRMPRITAAAQMEDNLEKQDKELVIQLMKTFIEGKIVEVDGIEYLKDGECLCQEEG